MAVNLRFAGDDSWEPLELGEHITVRLQKNYLGRIEEGDRVQITDLATEQRGYAWVEGLVWDVQYDDMTDLDWSLQRGPYRDAPALIESLQAMYPETNDRTLFVVVHYDTFMAEVQ